MKSLSLATFALAVIVATITAGTLAVRTATAGGGGCHEPKTDATGSTVDLRENCFFPTVLRVDEDATVTFESFDKQLHSVTGAGVNHPGGWGSFEELGEGSVVTETFEDPGVYPYFCILHAGMVGTIVVGDRSAKAAVAPRAGSLAPRGPAGANVDASDNRSVMAASAGGAVIALLVVAAGAGLLALHRRHPA